MRFARVLLCIFLSVSQLAVLVPRTYAAPSANVVIAQMYPGSTAGATQEFVELYNNAVTDVNVTNWCVSYISSTGGTTTKLGCLTAPDSQTKLWIKAGGYATFVSNEYKAAFNVSSDVSFAGGMSATAGHVKLTDSSNAEIDRLGWGSAASPEGTSTTAPSAGKSLQRKVNPAGLQDTDNNVNDFSTATPTLHVSSVYEVVTVIDLCPNIPDAQPTVPKGYAIDASGSCQPDSCLNIDGLQTSVPDRYDADAAGNCMQHDECDNLSGIQTDIPDNMIRSGSNDCAWDIVPLQITEVLPNAVGSDTGNEFIEVYNPTNRMINLSMYSVAVGTNQEKTYAFPIGSTIGPGEYRSFSDSAMKFTLVNTSSRVVLHAIDGSSLGDTGTYNSPAEGESWAFINGEWQYTNQPTPGTENQLSVEEDTPVDVTDSGLATCPAGKYRNPLTNRCRTIVEDAAILAACDEGQYRNPETGRCRKIDTTSLTACKDGQYRSEETNRCRNIVTASTQKPCNDNQFRSETTNRCHNLPVSTVPDAAYALQPVKQGVMAFVGWSALGGAGVLAAGYAGWEWRRDLVALWRRVTHRLS
ncbi:MAG: hypothetical protein JWO07_226 [Candidatus Saccharibacteria bacterium]|nr:hypothetical protein [Candidatus Saccharibacteria bacterium]